MSHAIICTILSKLTGWILVKVNTAIFSRIKFYAGHLQHVHPYLLEVLIQSEIIVLLRQKLASGGDVWGALECIS
jgi:hypothetical protein